MRRLATAAAAFAVLLLAPQAAAGAVGATTAFAPLTGHEPNFLAPGPDGNMWGVSTDAMTIWKVTPAGQITEYPAGPLGVPRSLTPRPGGFYAIGDEGIAELGTDGSLSMVWERSSCNACMLTPPPAELALASDGLLYSGSRRFTLGGSPTVECLGKERFVTDCLGDEVNFESPYPFGGGKGPGAPVIGDDGAIWTPVTNSAGPCPVAGVARLTTTGSHSFFARPDELGPCLMDAIAVGPEGDIWYTNDSRIGHLKRSGPAAGEFDEFSAGISAGARIWDIAKGPDGNLWFTERNANKVARITSGGVVTEFPGVASHAQPTSIAAGGDGNMWYAAAGAIVCVELTSPCPGPKEALTLFVTGEGTVAVPGGAACPPSCAHEYAAGTEVPLTAKAASGYEFVAWSGACTGSGGCSVLMDGPKSVRANFAKLASGGDPPGPTAPAAAEGAASPGAPAPQLGPARGAAKPKCRKGFKQKKVAGKTKCVKKNKKKRKQQKKRRTG